ncbi:MAG: O-antigen ligase [Acidobacteriaceae bacterium]|nr:O-antigen ligase [Acidobacteriaceae bacterium]
MRSKVFQIRRRSSLPFYCNPVLLFIFVWLVMLTSLWFKITVVSYPNFSLPVLIFVASLLSFLLGYYLIRGLYRKHVNSCASACYQIEVTRLRRFNLILACAALPIIIYNYVVSGLPPFFGFFGLDAKSVNSYGRLEQLLAPILMSLFVNAFLDVSAKRKAFYAIYAFSWMLFYGARGGIIFMLFQALVALSIRTSMSKKKIYLIALASVVCGGVFFGVFGNYRTTNAILFAGMRIKPEFQEWPTIYVWIISYISTALSNLCWYVDLARFDHATWTFSYTLLPSFWVPENPHVAMLTSSNIVDGTSTYLASYFLDFSYFGIFLANLLLGIASGIASVANRIGRNFLFWSVFLSCMGFIFFWDFFATLSVIILFSIQATAQRYFIQRLPPRRSFRKLEENAPELSTL